MSETHVPPTVAQRQHVNEAVRNPQLAARANGGHPAIAATARPASFNGPGVVSARGAPPRAAAPAAAPAAHAPANAPANAYRPQAAGAPHPQTNAPKAPPKAAPKAPKPKPEPGRKDERP